MFDNYRQWLYKTGLSKFIKKLVKANVSPNFITGFGLIVGLIAAFFIYKSYFLIAIIFLFLTTVCDICDGWVARAGNKATKFGVLFDVTSDKYVEGLIGLAFAFVTPAFLIPGYIWVVIAVFGSIVISLVSNVGRGLSNDNKPFKLASRFDRGLVVVAGLVLASFLGNIYLTYTVVVLAVLTHLTVLGLILSYYKVLKKKK